MKFERNRSVVTWQEARSQNGIMAKEDGQVTSLTTWLSKIVLKLLPS